MAVLLVSDLVQRAVRKASVAATGALVLVLACASTSSSAPAPDVTPPPGVSVVREVQAGGVQVYTCRADATGAYHWVLLGPEAILINNDGTPFGTHSTGPTWTATDSSSISADGAHPLATVARPDAVPALLLKVTSSRGNGVLTGVTLVRRSDTEGGVAPSTGCDAANVNANIARHYSAVYTFYR